MDYFTVSFKCSCARARARTHAHARARAHTHTHTHIQGVSGGIANILGGGRIDYSE